MNEGGTRSVRCPRCQAGNRVREYLESVYCWKCGYLMTIPVDSNAWSAEVDFPAESSPLAREDGEAKPGKLAGAGNAPRAPVKKTSEMGDDTLRFGLTTLFLVITLVAIVLALYRAAPGLAVLVGICTLPPVVRTAMLNRRAKSIGRPLTAGRTVGYFLSSFGTTFVILFGTLQVVALSAAAALLFMCFAGMGAYSLIGPGSEAAGVFLGISGSLLGIAFFLVPLVFAWRGFIGWIRKRWRRDVDQL